MELASTRESLCAWIIASVAERTGAAESVLDPSERFRRLGLDSAGATAMLAELGTKLGRALVPTLAWQFPTPLALARYLAGEEGPAAVAPLVLRSTPDEPIAIVGLACRLPGAADPEAYWRLLRDGVDAIREVPPERWDVDAHFDADLAARGKMSTRWGGFLDDVGAFDPAFFGISAREAGQIDPQQRLMLELSWEALEDARVVPSRLKDTRTGVFFGAMWTDFGRLQGGSAEHVDLHTATGQDLSIIPARVSYSLGLLGPSIAVNTACSSSLVAIHLARQSLLTGESTLALAGGVNLLISPYSTVAMSKFGAMSPDGRSKAFDARANGYVRGEGGGVVALKRLSAAIADGDRIYCVIRGSAVNNDGFSNGLTAPSPMAQEAVIRDACREARVAPSDVQYVEAHGTGTMLGDPIEVNALGSVLGENRPAERTLRIGSVKTNIGHLEAAAGVAGLIKVALSMKHGALPASLHYQRPNPHIAFDALRVRVQAAFEPWEAEDGRRVAGVSSFGFGGTNAHLVVESAAPVVPRLVRGAAKSAAALREWARTYALERAPWPSLESFGSGAFRLATTARSVDDLVRQLEEFAAGRAPPFLSSGEAPDARPDVALLFGGQGSQWAGMGRALLQEESGVRALLDRCDAAMRPYLGVSLVDQLRAGDPAAYERTAFVQPAVFAVQVALAEALRVRGVVIGAVVGASMGEVAAAFVAGALTIEDAARIMCLRSQIVGKARGQGGMLATGLALDAAHEMLRPYDGRLVVGVSSGPTTTVVAGDEDALASLTTTLTQAGIYCRRVAIDYASHSAHMDPLLPEMREALASVRPRDGTIPFWSTVTGGLLEGRALDAEYWVRNLREPVAFAPTIGKLIGAGFRVFVEADPHPVLTQGVTGCLAHAGVIGHAITLGGREEPELETLHAALGQLFVAGVDARVDPSEPGGPSLVVLSAKSASAVTSQASRLWQHLLAHPELGLADVAYSLATTRTSMEHRLALSVASLSSLSGALSSVSRGETPSCGVRGVARASGGKVAWLFTGQGSQKLGMGRELYAQWPVFRAAMDEALGALREHVSTGVDAVMWASASSSQGALLDETEHAQPALFAFEWALSTLWRSWGMVPDVVAGHSLGELVAACVAGVFSLSDGARLVAARGRLMQALPRGGAMVSVAASEGEVLSSLVGHAATVFVGAVNGPQSVVLSGVEADVLAVASGFASRGIRTKRLEVSHAFHSALMDPMLDAFRRVAESVTYRAATLGVVSNVSGALAGPELASAEYWVRHARASVRFEGGVGALLASGVDTFVEIGPRGTLLALVAAMSGEGEVTLVPSLRAERPESEALLLALGTLHASGAPVEWSGVYPQGGRRVELPTYPWQRERHWVDVPLGTRSGAPTDHALLGVRLASAGAEGLYEKVLSQTSPSWLVDHKLGGEVVVPGAALCELARAAVEDCLGPASEVTGLVIPSPLVLAEHEHRRVQVTVGEQGTRVSIFSQMDGAEPGAAWTLHATGIVAATPPLASRVREDIDALRRRCVEEDVPSLYASFAARGLQYGERFRGLRRFFRGTGELLAEVSLAEGLDPAGYGVHPALLDAAIQAAAAMVVEDAGAWIPFEMGRLSVEVSGRDAAYVHVRAAEGATAGGQVFNVTLTDARGDRIAELAGLRMRRASAATSENAAVEAFYRLAWERSDGPEKTQLPAGRWLVVGDDEAATVAASALVAAGATCERVAFADLAAALPAEQVVCIWSAGEGSEGGEQAAQAGLRVVKALSGEGAAPRLWWVTREAVSVAAADCVSPGSAPLWGLGRTLMAERPELGCTLVDVGPGGDPSAALLRELAATDDESQVAWRDGQRYVARLVHAGAADVAAPLCLRTAGSVVITGGLGALGREVARSLARRGIAHLVLLGRGGMATSGASELVAELASYGARVTVFSVDISNREALSGVLSALPPELPLRGVVHAAGVVDDGMLAEQTAERFARVLSPKIRGAWNLHALTQGSDLDFFVLFSSVAGLFGSAGQGGYAAGNAYLDGLAAHRRGAGFPALSLAWGAWAGVGMAALLDRSHRSRLARHLGELSASQGIALFEASLGRPEALLGVTLLDLRALGKGFGGSVPAFWRSLVRVSRVPTGAWARELSELSPERRAAVVLAGVQSDVARILSMSGAGAVSPNRPLAELGLDSLTAVELRNVLGQRAGAPLPATLAFDYPTAAAIAKYLLADVLHIEDAMGALVDVTATASSDEPIAIVGMGCRYPGGITDPDSFWTLLEGGVDAITEVPPERWDIDALYDPDPDARGKMVTRSGGFLRGFESFDASFFGISAREASRIDPQQRLLLETTWEGLERAGIVPESLVGSDTGVFVGLMYNDYASFAGDLGDLDGYVGTGTLGSVASGRISYLLGLQGPSMTVDTACSSSLVTLHLACQSLRQGECRVALAGGVALMLTPASFVEFSRLRGLAPDGRCKSFSAAADGVAWGEGCGMLVLERLSDAQRNGHPVLAVIRGSAVNQDGRSNGLSAPNGPSQRAVIREALRRSGVSASSIGYVECHGTGTKLGDPIEVQALGAELSPGREAPVVIGSAKSNLGHTQAAAGAAGVMKAVLLLQHGVIPKSLHFDAPSPHIPWSDLPVKVAAEAVAWPRGAEPRLVGVSSFGISGTNAHVVIEEPPLVDAPPQASSAQAASLVVLSAKSASAVTSQASRLWQHLLAHPELGLADVAYSLATTRTSMEHRLALSVASLSSLSGALSSVSRGETPSCGVRGVARASGGKVAWLFTGQGSQKLGMGRELYAQWPVFRAAMDEALGALREHVSTGVDAVMWASASSSQGALLDETEHAQPALFAFEWALSTLWRSWGMVPDVVAGHSLGELVAACVAGVFSLSDGARLVAARGRLMQALPRGGAMVSVAASEGEVLSSLVGHAATVFVGAVNGPQSVVLSGVEADVLAVASGFASRGIRTKRLEVSHAFHSALMDPMLDAFRRVAESVTYRAATLGVVSNVSGALAGPELASAEYWVRHARASVRFEGGVGALLASGVDTFVEIGPRGTLLALVAAMSGEGEVTLVPSLRAERPESEALLLALGTLHASGAPVEWSGVYPQGGRRVELPTYPWQRERHWVDVPLGTRSGAPTDHALLGVRLASAGAEVIFESMLSSTSPSWVDEHRVGSRIVLPGAALGELARAAAENVLGGAVEVGSLVFQAPLVLPERGAVRVQVVVSEEGSRVAISSQLARAGSASAWILHASGEARAAREVARSVDVSALRERCSTPREVALAYEAFASAGLLYGAAFQGIRALWTGAGEALAEVRLADGIEPARYGLHPALLDAAFQTALCEAEGAADGAGAWVPFELGRLVVHEAGVASALVHACAVEMETAGTRSFDVVLMDDAGAVFAEVTGLRLRRLSTEALAGADATSEGADPLYRLEWREAPSLAPSLASGRWLIVGGEGGAALATALRSGGANAACVASEELVGPPSAEHVVYVTTAHDAVEAADDVLRLVQAFVRQSAAPRLWLATCHAVAVERGDDVACEGSAVWGMGRTVMLEHPELGCTLVDVADWADLPRALSCEAASTDGETQVAWRDGKRHVARLVRAPEVVVPAGNYGLETTRRGVLDSLRLHPALRRPPGPGEVEIAVRASGLNFRDVLNALGMYPGDAGLLGSECAGVVVGVGAGVERLAVGDRVMSLAPGSIQRFVTVDERVVIGIPCNLSFEEAATIPVVFLTAWYAFHDLASLKAGERVVIHAAAGGVGMAAVQIAQWLGADVLGTASPAKWGVVRSLGVKHVASSRDLDFAEAFQAACGGADVVLNALAGPFVDASLSLLSPGGRFVEMGKADIRDAVEVAERHPGVAYRAFDVWDAGADRIGEMLREICAGFSAGHLRALPVRTFGVSEAESAFRWMAQARHVGKIALSTVADLRTDGAVLITGGLGALGMHAARWLAARGVRHVVLTSRGGPESPGASSAVEELAALGVTAEVAAVDVSDENALRRLVSTVASARPLRGVVHAAGVLDDGVLREQTSDRLRGVMRPKVEGARNLHEVTRGADLDLFVLFSSVAGTLGAAGQGPYAAGNAYLDGLASHRRALGLPAVSLAWGPWSGGGMASSLDAASRARLTAQGMKALTPAQGVAMMARALERPDAELVAAALELGLVRSAVGEDIPPVWRALLRGPSKRRASAAGTFARDVAALPKERQADAIREVVAAEVARVLSMGGASNVELERPLRDVGIDSLMAVELRNALGRRLGVALPATLVFDYPTPAAIAEFLLEKALGLADAAPSRAAAPGPISFDEPIAIVGLGCRFPGGAKDAASFWRVLDEEVDAITEVPIERWDIDAWYDTNVEAAGKMNTRWGGFLPGLEQFDPEFFGLSPREATSVDPQERLILETAWEALESAGFRAETLMDSSTGVYMGLCSSEYQTRAMRDVSSLDASSLLGTAHSAMVGRLSYWLGLKGPNLPVDTACSSSLVAVHLACQALRQGECSLALAGGANVVLDPTTTVYFSRLRVMSPTGRCRAFSADGDGYVRSEGAGVVVLERLSDAQRNGHRVLAVIRGSAVNQDGRSNGMTAPNGPSQEAVIREALRRSGVRSDTVGYLECHGTGTPLGDPIEVQAAAAVYGEGRAPGSPLLLGSVKTNLGHTEGAAGIAGLLKVVLALEHGKIPRSLHFNAPNPHVAWADLPVKVASESSAWPRRAEPRRAGISSFGFSGTNAHVILEEAPALAAVSPPSAEAPRSAELVLLSARSAAAVSATAAQLAAYLSERPDLTLGEVAKSLATTRTHHEHRLAFAARSREDLQASLEVAARGETPAGGARARGASGASRVVFVFPGQGSQWVGMGRTLLEEEPAFREALLRCDRAIQAEAGWSLVEALAAPGDASLQDRIDVAQPALFAMGVALAALWRSWGVEPDLVVGHSMGEVAAACVAGALTLEQGVAVICRRSLLLQQISGLGAMALVELSRADAESALRGYEDRLSVAVSNSPRSTVLSGDPAALDEVVARLESRAVFCRRVKVDVASHSPQVDRLLGALVAALHDVKPTAASVPMRSTVTGERIEGPELSGTYWASNLRQPVRFAEVVENVFAEGPALFVEISPHPLLVQAVEEIGRGATVAASRGVAVGSLRRDKPERASLLEALGALYVARCPLDFARLFPAERPCVALPTYPWQRQRYWLEAAGAIVGSGAELVRHRGGHPLLGPPTLLATKPVTRVWETSLGGARLPWLHDHRVAGAVLFPAAGYFEMALAVGAESFEGADVEIVDATISEALVLHASSASSPPPVPVQVVATEDHPGRVRCQVASQGPFVRGLTWTVHSRAIVRRAPAKTPSETIVDLAALRGRFGPPITGAAFYAALSATGLVYGPAFQGIAELWRGEGEALGRLALPSAAGGAADYRLHPALLDACLQVMAGALSSNETSLWVPVAMASLRLHGPSRGRAGTLWCHARLTTVEGGTSERRRRGDLSVYDASGAVVAEIAGFVVQQMDPARARRPEDDWFMAIDWEPSQLPPPTQKAGRFLLVGEGGGLGAKLAAALEREGHAVAHAAPGAEHGLDDSNVAGMRSLLGRAFPGSPPTAVVHLRSLEDPGSADIEGALVRGCDSVLHTVQAMTGMGWRDAPRLWLVTRGAQAVARGQGVSVAQACLLGLGRVVALEHPELACARIDLDPAASTGDSHLLCAELLADEREDEIAWRSDERRVARLARITLDETVAEREEAADGRAFGLAIDKPGVLDRLLLRERPRRPPAAGEVEIAVKAAGLNFLDVLLAMGVMPDEDVAGSREGLEGKPADRARMLGGECAGRVVAVGEGVNLAVGERVIALARGSLGSHVTTPEALVALCPPALSASQAAAVPIAYLTAWYALSKVGRLQKGERVLIHSATGGVGLAAVQWAQHVGAEVFATAGSVEKRALLKELGVRYVSDSRSDGFVSDIREWTGGEGVDVVLNSLSGELIEKSFGLLRSYGRFVEIGKSDYRANTPLGLRPFLRSLSFSLVDLRAMTQERPALVGALLEELLGLFLSGVFSPPQVESFPLARAADAFRKMARAEHVGKLVLTLDGADAEKTRVHVAAERRTAIRASATYLVTGGLGGLGLSVATWLAERGAGHLVLVGRTGVTTEAQKASVATMEALGAMVTVAAADVSDAAALAEVLARIDAARPLRGVIHAAGLLDDALLEQQSPARLRNAMAPKVMGALNLHTLTKGVALDFFVLYGSAAGLLGSAGQANYAAANTFLDALAHHRRSLGLPAVSIDWGAFSDVGLAAAQAKRGERLAGRGMASLSAAQGLTALARVLQADLPQVGVVAIDVRQWSEYYPAVATSRMLSRLRAPSLLAAASGNAALLERLGVAGAEGRVELLQEFLGRQVSEVLRIPVENIDLEAPLTSLGMDSLMGLELRNRIEAALGVAFPATVVWTYPTVAALGRHLATASQGPSQAPPARPSSVVVSSREVTERSADTSGIATMAEDDLFALLDAELDLARSGNR